jgi:uncharacterized protein YegP (UPF0339 family)
MAAMGKRVGVFVVLATFAFLMGMSISAEGQDKKGKAAAPGLTFEVYKDKGGEFRYRIVDETGANLGGSGKGYDKKEDLLKIVNTIKKEAAAAKIDDQSGKK